MPTATMIDPITSDQPKRSPSQKAAIATPSGGDRKWNVAARTAPIRLTSWNQMNVAPIPGARMV